MSTKNQAWRWPNSRLRWFLLVLLGVVLAVLFAAYRDWEEAVREAQHKANGYAWYTATHRFLEREWIVPEVPQGWSGSVESPPKAGAYAAQRYAAHAEVVFEWWPRFHPIIGGPYLVRGKATAAVLRNDRGEWMPLLVE